MLTEKLYNAMNEQMMLEFASSNLYKSMASWCESKGFKGSAIFLNAHANEEMEHMEKLFDYINKTGNRAILGTLEAPQAEFGSLREVFEQTFKHEQYITKQIFALADLSLELKDFSTFNFLQWYTAEQHEEEALFHGIIEKFNLIGEEGKGLYMIDKEIGNLLKQN